MDTDDAPTGTHAAKSGPIGNNKVTWMRRTVSGANMGFWYRIDSETGGDVFIFYRGGRADIHASGTTGWTFYSVGVPPGGDTLLWENANDGGASSGSGAVRIDDWQSVSTIGFGPILRRKRRKAPRRLHGRPAKPERPSR